MVSNTKIKLDIVMASPEFRKDDGMYELINQSKTIKNAGACEWITQFNHVGQGGQQFIAANTIPIYPNSKNKEVQFLLDKEHNPNQCI